MRNKVLYIFLLSIICCCCNSKQNEVIDDNYRLAAIKADCTNEDFIVYNNIPLGKDKAYVDSLIENDTTCLPFNSTYYYTLRRAKQCENSDRDLYYILGYGGLLESYGIAKTNRFYGSELQSLKKTIKDDPKALSLFIDYFSDRLFKANIIIETEKSKGKKEYSELDGWFCYHSYKDTIFSVSCAFSKILYDKNEDINNLINSLKETLNAKYGTSMKSEKTFYKYLDDTSYYEKNGSWEGYAPKRALRNLNIVDAYSWINGSFETQLLVNKVYNNNSDYQEYEFIVNYLDNKFVFEKKDILEKIKNEEMQKEQEKEDLEKRKEQDFLKKKALNQTL